MKDEVLEEMLPYLQESYGNPSAMYELAGTSKKALAKARQRAASVIGADPDEIFFTSGGTESDNWALVGIAEAFRDKGRHIITSSIEHPAILQTCDYLDARGFEITYLPVDSQGFVDPVTVADAIRPDTILVSVMAANNEVGTLEPIAEIGAVCKEKNVLFHTDAVQAFGQIPLDVSKMHIDLLSASSHKIYGPKGTGFLYVAKGVPLRALIHGGGQERSRRSGTENVAGIVGFGKACELAAKTLEERMKRERRLRDFFIQRATEAIPRCELNGPAGDLRLPNNINLSLFCVEGESALILLDLRGIAASSGSACSTGSIDPSHVLVSMGQDERKARSSLRFTISDDTTMEELEETLGALSDIAEQLRSMSADWPAEISG